MRAPGRLLFAWPATLLAAAALACASSTAVGGKVAASLTISPDSLTLKPGQSSQLTVVAKDSSGAVITGAPITYTTSVPVVAGVSTSGRVRANTYGHTAVSAASGTATAACAVLVPAPDSITATIPVAGGTYGIDVKGNDVVYATVPTGQVAHLSLTSLTLVRTFNVGSAPTGVAFSPNGASAYVTNQLSNTLGIITVASDSQTGIVGLTQNPFVTLPAPTGSDVMVTGNAGALFEVNPATQSVVSTIQVGSTSNGLVFNHAGTRLYASDFLGGKVSEVDPSSMTILRTFVTTGAPQGVALAANDSTLYVANEAGWVDVWSIGTGNKTSTIPLAGGGFGLARSPDDSILYVSIPALGEVELIGRKSGQVVKTLTTGGDARRIAFSADGHHAVVANLGGWVTVIGR